MLTTHRPRKLALLLPVDIERRFLRGRRKSGVAESLEPWQQRLATEALPALTRVPQRDHDPPIIGGPGCVVGLAFGKTPIRGMNTSERRFVLILGPTGEPVDNAESRPYLE
jgi:hypothetical protein